jgi:putative transposase
VAERSRDLIRQICQARGVVIIRGAVSPDHMHMLLSARPVLSPAKLAQYINGRSSSHLLAERPQLRKRYWGQYMWARGYFCAMMGAVDEVTIKADMKAISGTKTTSASRSQRHQAFSRLLADMLQTA